MSSQNNDHNNSVKELFSAISKLDTEKIRAFTKFFNSQQKEAEIINDTRPIFSNDKDVSQYISQGNNTVWGGDGKEIFAWDIEEHPSIDVIKDFIVGQDIVDLSAYSGGTYMLDLSNNNDNNAQIAIVDSFGYTLQTLIILGVSFSSDEVLSGKSDLVLI